MDKETKIILLEIRDDIGELKTDNKTLLNKYIEQAIDIGKAETQLKINTKVINKLEGLVWKLIFAGLTSGSIGGGIVASVIGGN